METLEVECLRCGRTRSAQRTRFGHVAPEACPRCDYLGWAETATVTELERRTLRERPLERRRLRLVA